MVQVAWDVWCCVGLWAGFLGMVNVKLVSHGLAVGWQPAVALVGVWLADEVWGAGVPGETRAWVFQVAWPVRQLSVLR
eukprot:10452976-Alexandrium_andersonii.AAC.1